MDKKTTQYVVCPKCGRDNFNRKKHCWNCGESLKDGPVSSREPLLDVEPRKRRPKRWLFGVASLCIGVILGIVLAYEPPPAPIAHVDNVIYSVPQELRAVGKAVGLSDVQLTETHAQIGGATDGCSAEWAAGCYDPRTKTVRVYVVSFTSGTASQTLAYEYNHYYWREKMTEEQRVTLLPDIYSVYDQLQGNPNFMREVNSLIKAEGALHTIPLDDEMHAIACTEVSDRYLSSALLANCNEIIPHRENVPRRYQ